MSATIQLGSFLFSDVAGDPQKVFIQIVGDGEAGYFRKSKLPEAVRRALEKPTDAANFDNQMWQFWRKNF